MQKALSEIRDYLTKNMYTHWKVNRMTSKAKRIVVELFDIYLNEPQCLPSEWSDMIEKPNINVSKERLISDYIAGMTDRFAIKEHKRLYDLNTGWQQ